MKLHESKEKQEKFVELRAINGLSLNEISKELSISKTTSIAWEKKYKANIARSQRAHLSMLVDTYEQSLKDRFEELVQLSSKIKNELLNRSFSDVKTEKLAQLYLETKSNINSFIEKNTFNERDAEDPFSERSF